MYRETKPNCAESRRTALRGTHDDIHLLQERWYERQEQLAGHDRRTSVEFVPGALYIGVNPVPITRQRDEMVDLILCHRSPVSGSKFGTHEGSKIDRPHDTKHPRLCRRFGALWYLDHPGQSFSQIVASSALPSPPAAAIAASP